MLPDPASPTPPAPTPTPRQLLTAAQLLAAGEPESLAAAQAGLPPDAIDGLSSLPGFAALVRDCEGIEALPRAEEDARLQRLVRRALERALADGRLGAIPAALRLLGLLPTRPARAAPEAADAASGVGGREACPQDAGARWGMMSDGEGDWVGPDGLPVMPGRPLALADAPGGPVRVLDVNPDAIPLAFLETLDGFDQAAVRDFNRSAHPRGGLQWDPATRTLWSWGESAEGPERTGVEDEATAPVELASDLPTLAALPTVVPKEPAPEPPPEARPAAPPRRHVAAEAPRPDDLESRVRRLLEEAAPPGPADADLAEAVCALRWPNWPAYRGSLDLTEVRRALHGRRVDERTLTRLGGSACTRPTPPAQASESPQRESVPTDRSARPRRRRRREVDDRAATAAVLRRT